MTITVVGAGVIGCAIAHELAARGARVRMLDPRGIGDGATRASAGILAPHVEGHSSALLKLGVCSLSLYEQFISRVRADAGADVEYDRGGTLQVALDAAQDAELENLALVLAETDVEHRLLDGREARREEPALAAAVSAALLIPAHGFVAAVPLTQALARAAINRGATISARRVEGIEPSAAGVEVVTSEERFPSDAVIIAAGSWSSELAGQLARPRTVGGEPAGAANHAAQTASHEPLTSNQVRPIRGQLLQLRVLPPVMSRVVWGTGCYLVPWQDGTVLAGATVEDVGFDESATAMGVRSLLEAASMLVPALAEAAFEGVRVGLRPKTADELPLVGPSSTMRHVFYATGHYRNGVLLAPLTAAVVADLVLDGIERSELSVMSPRRAGL